MVGWNAGAVVRNLGPRSQDAKSGADDGRDGSAYSVSMTTLTKQRMTVGEFLVWAEAQTEGKYELVNGEIVRMAPERLRHNLSKAEIWVVLRAALRAAGLSNTVFTDGAGVEISDVTGRGPDAVVAASADHDLDAMMVDDPLIVVEVVSPSSEKTDTIDKLAEYFSLPSVRHYIVVWPAESRLDHHARDDHGVVVKRTLRPGDTLRFDPPGFEVQVANLLSVKG